MNNDEAYSELSALSIGGFALMGALGAAPIGALIGWTMGKALVGAGIGALIGAVGGGATAAVVTSVGKPGYDAAMNQGFRAPSLRDPFRVA